MTAIESVKQKWEKRLLKLANVTGVGIGKKYVKGKPTKETCIVIFVTRKLPKEALKPQDLVPAEIEGVKTDVREATFKALTTPEEKQKKWRPAKGGVSIGHFLITAGTFGCLVKDKTDGEKVILSNNHVLANSNIANVGDPIVQPGVYDGGNVLTDTIAKLKRFVPIQFEQGSTCPIAKGFCAVYNALAKVLGAKTRLVTVKEVYNTVDCAIASPVSPDVVSDEVIDIGVPQDVTVPTVGLRVKKSGRTTCLTHGEIDTVDLTVRVMYDYKTALFKDQIGIQPTEGKFSSGGDSGSAIVAEDEPKIVGLLFAGDESGYTIANKIQNVMDELNVEV
jgi:hypothetical protein